MTRSGPRFSINLRPNPGTRDGLLMDQPVIAVFDANILCPAPLRDLFIRIAQTGLMLGRWSETIEWTRNVLVAACFDRGVPTSSTGISIRGSCCVRLFVFARGGACGRDNAKSIVFDASVYFGNWSTPGHLLVFAWGALHGVCKHTGEHGLARGPASELKNCEDWRLSGNSNETADC